MVSLFAGVGHTPNAARAVICHVESAILTHGYSYRAAPNLSICRDESGKKILVLTSGFAVLHRNPYNLVASAIRTVPRPMLRCEAVAVILGWEGGFASGVKGHSERSHMGLNQYIRGNDLGLELRMGAHQSRILMTPHVEPGPTIEAAF